MKLNSDLFAGFLVDIDVWTYCERHIEPAFVELDNVGLQAFAAAVINPAGIAVDVLYLDRSEGEEVTQHQWPVLGNVLDAPTIRLLYRPYVPYELDYS